VEEKRVVFGKIPLNVVAGLIHPVAVIEDGMLDPVVQLRS
jgi:hypothetical protein